MIFAPLSTVTCAAKDVEKRSVHYWLCSQFMQMQRKFCSRMRRPRNGRNARMSSPRSLQRSQRRQRRHARGARKQRPTNRQIKERNAEQPKRRKCPRTRLQNPLPRPKQPGLRPQSLQLEPSPLKLREKMRLKRNTPKPKVARTFAVPSPPKTAKTLYGAKAANATGLTRTGGRTVPKIIQALRAEGLHRLCLTQGLALPS